MSSFDWSQFVVRIPVRAKTEDLYKAWATRKGIEYWFLRMSDYRHPDGSECLDDEMVTKGVTYAWRWHGWPDDVEELGTILDCNGKDFFKFSFGKAGICAVSIKNEAGQAIVELTQTEIPSDDHGRQYWHVGCKTGWTFYFANMKSLFEGGLDLRNKDEQLKNVVNA